MDKSFYNRDNNDIIALIFAVQCALPVFSCLFFILCFVYYWMDKKCLKQYSAPPDKNWSTIAAYYGVSFYCTLFIFTLDCAAVAHRNDTDNTIIDNERLKNLVIAPMIFDGLAVMFIVILIFKCICCRYCYKEEREKVYKWCSCSKEKEEENQLVLNQEEGQESGEKLEGEVQEGDSITSKDSRNEKGCFTCCKDSRNEKGCFTCCKDSRDDNHKDKKYGSGQFICLSLAGLAPFVCIASHAPFVLIAWITDPNFASGIGVFYGISLAICFLTFKLIYYYSNSLFLRLIPISKYQHREGYTELEPKQGRCKRCFFQCCVPFCFGETVLCHTLSCAALLSTLAFGLLPIACIAMIACFFIYIPINNSIEDTPTKIYAIYQGIIAVLTALLAYIVVVKPGSFSITRAVKKALNEINETKGNVIKDHWNKISNDERLAGVLRKAVEDYVVPNAE